MIALRAILLFGFFSLAGFTYCCKSEEDLAIGEFLLGRLQNHIYSPFNGITKIDDESIIEIEPKEQDAVKKMDSAAMNKVTKTKGKENQRYKSSYLQKTTSEVLRALATKKVETRQDDDCEQCSVVDCFRAIRNSIVFTIIALIMRKIRKAVDKYGLERDKKEKGYTEKLKIKIGK